MKVRKQIIGILAIALTFNVSCTQDDKKSKAVKSIQKKGTNIQQKSNEKRFSSTSKFSKKSISERLPPPPPTIDDDHRNYFIPPLSDDDLAEIRDQKGDYFGDAINEMPQGERYSTENAEPQRAQLELFSDPEEPAEFPGGAAAMNKFIKDNLIYPPLAIEMNLQGKCYIQFIVNVDGSISNVKIMRGVTDCPECDQEALRVIKTMPKWNPGKLNSKEVGSYYTLPIIFKMI